MQRGERLLGREDADVADAVAEILREDGVEVLLKTGALRVAPGAGGAIELTVGTPDGERTLSGSHLLVAVGRTPNSDSLNLGAAGVETDKHGFIKTNERLETNVPGIYVVGDVKGGPAFTHISYDDFRILRTNLLRAATRRSAAGCWPTPSLSTRSWAGWAWARTRRARPGAASAWPRCP